MKICPQLFEREIYKTQTDELRNKNYYVVRNGVTHVLGTLEN